MGGRDYESKRGGNGTSLKCIACNGVGVCWSKEGNEGTFKVGQPGPKSRQCHCLPFVPLPPPVPEDPAFSCSEETFQEKMQSLSFEDLNQLKHTLLFTVYQMTGVPIVSVRGTPPDGFIHENHKPGHNNGKESTLYFKLHIGGWFCVHAKRCPMTKKLRIFHIPETPLSLYCCGPPRWAKEDWGTSLTEEPPHSPSPDAQEGNFDDIFSDAELLEGLSPGSHAEEPSRACLKGQEDANEIEFPTCGLCAQGGANCELKCKCNGAPDKRYCEECLHNLFNTRLRYPMPAYPAIQKNCEEMMTCAFCKTQTHEYRMVDAAGVSIFHTKEWKIAVPPHGWIYNTPYFSVLPFDRDVPLYEQHVKNKVDRIETLQAHLDANQEEKGELKNALEDLQGKQKLSGLTASANQQLKKLPGQIELKAANIKKLNDFIVALEKTLPHWVQDTTGNASFSRLPHDQGTSVSFASLDAWLNAESNRIQTRSATRSSWAQEELVHIPETLYLPSDFSSSDSEDEGDDTSTFHPARNLLVDLAQFDSDEDDEEACPASSYMHGPSRNTRSAARFQLQPRSNIRNH